MPAHRLHLHMNRTLIAPMKESTHDSANQEPSEKAYHQPTRQQEGEEYPRHDNPIDGWTTRAPEFSALTDHGRRVVGIHLLEC